MTLLPFHFPSPMAGTARTFTARRDIKILAGKRMAMLAMSPSFLGVRWPTAFANAVSQIISLSSQKQMGRIHAWRIIAAMQNAYASGDWPNRKLIGKSVGVNNFTVRFPEASISVVENVASPIPARVGLVYKTPKSFFCSHVVNCITNKETK
jgi:hypothetical protein